MSNIIYEDGIITYTFTVLGDKDTADADTHRITTIHADTNVTNHSVSNKLNSNTCTHCQCACHCHTIHVKAIKSISHTSIPHTIIDQHITYITLNDAYQKNDDDIMNRTINHLCNEFKNMDQLHDSYNQQILLWSILLHELHITTELSQLIDLQYPSMHRLIHTALHDLTVHEQYDIEDAKRMIIRIYRQICEQIHRTISSIRISYQRCEPPYTIISSFIASSSPPSHDNEGEPHHPVKPPPIGLPTYVPLTSTIIQDLLVHHVMLNPISIRYPADHKYRYDFWLCVSKHIELSNYEIHEEILREVERDMLQLRKTREQGDLSETQSPSNIILEYSDNSENHERHHVVIRSYIGFHRDVGCALWPAGYTLSEYIIDHSDTFKDKRILSLGSGCGLTEIILHQVCPTYQCMIATDYNHDILSNMCINFMRNGMNVRHRDIETGEDDDSEHMKNKLSDRNTMKKCSSVSNNDDLPLHESTHTHTHTNDPYVEVMQLDWFHVTPNLIKNLNVDLILSADTIYLPETHSALAQCFKLALLRGKSMNRHVKGYMCQPIRNIDTYHHYIQSFHDAGLILTEVSLDDVTPRFLFDRIDTHLHCVTLAE